MIITSVKIHIFAGKLLCNRIKNLKNQILFFMIIKTIIFFSLFLFSLTIKAQNPRISVTADPQFVWLASDNEKDRREGLMMGINTGLETDFFFAERYAFTTGITLDNLGGKLSYSDTTRITVSGSEYLIPSGTMIKQRIQYLGIPLGLKLKTQEIGYSTYFVKLGFTPMINIRSRGRGGVLPDKVNFAGETNLLNLNYFFSLGVEYSLGGTTSLFGGLGYSSGFMDVTKRPEHKITTRSLFIKSGILF